MSFSKHENDLLVFPFCILFAYVYVHVYLVYYYIYYYYLVFLGGKVERQIKKGARKYRCPEQVGCDFSPYG